PMTTAANPGNPSATSKGATIAAGVPKPEAPSMNEPNNQAITIIWTLLSGLIVSKPARILYNPPEYFRDESNNSAPKIMYRTSKLMNRPCIPDAAMAAASISQHQNAIPTVLNSTKGMTYLAGSRNPASSSIAKKMGIKANAACSDKL